MSRIVPYRNAPAARRRPATAFGRGPAHPRRTRWFPIALMALPLAALSAVLLLPIGGGGQAAAGAVPVLVADAGDRELASFPLCSGPARVTCVVDGDTIWYRGEKIRIADLDTPEVGNPGCANEAAMGRKATRRLQALLNAGPFSLESNPDGRSEDRYGRSLKLITRGGVSLGGVLVDEGLAEEWGGAKRAWC